MNNRSTTFKNIAVSIFQKLFKTKHEWCTPIRTKHLALWRVTISWVTITFLKTIANQHFSHRSDASLKTEIYRRSKSKMKKIVWSIRCLAHPQLGPRSFCSILYYVFYKTQNAQPKMFLGSQSLSNAPVFIPSLYDQGFLKNQHERGRRVHVTRWLNKEYFEKVGPRVSLDQPERTKITCNR